MMAQRQDQQKYQLKELHIVLQSLTELFKLFNSFCCTIYLVSIQRFIMFLSQSLHIQTGGALQGFWFKAFFVHMFLKTKHLILLLFLSQFCIIRLIQCIVQLFFQIFYTSLQCLDLDINYPYCVIFDLFSDIIYFGFCF